MANRSKLYSQANLWTLGNESSISKPSVLIWRCWLVSKGRHVTSLLNSTCVCVSEREGEELLGIVYRFQAIQPKK